MLETFGSLSRIHILLFAALITLTFGWLFSGAHYWTMAGVVAFDWFVVGLMNRATDVREDAANGVGGVDFVAQNRTLLKVLGGVLILASFFVFHAYEPTLTLVRICFHALAIFYSFPILPGRVRLKQIYIVKSVAAALGFVLTGFAYPLAKVGWGFFELPIGIEQMTLLIAGAYLFLFHLGFEIIHDLRDIQGDAAAGVESFPVVLGPELAVTIIDRLLAFSAIGLVVGFATYFVPWRVLILASLPVVQLVIYKRAIKRGFRASDCVVVTAAGVAVLAVYHTWIGLQLPGIFE